MPQLLLTRDQAAYLADRLEDLSDGPECEFIAFVGALQAIATGHEFQFSVQID